MNSLWAAVEIRIHTDRHAGIIGLFSTRHMPINELFRGVGVRFSSQSVQQIQSPFSAYWHSSSFLALDWRKLQDIAMLKMIKSWKTWEKLSLLSSFRQVSIHKAFIINSVTTGGAVCCTSHWWRTMYHFFSLEKGCSLSVCCSIAWSICSLQPYRSSLPGLINNSRQRKQQTTCEKWGVLMASHFSQFGLGLTFFS